MKFVVFGAWSCPRNWLAQGRSWIVLGTAFLSLSILPGLAQFVAFNDHAPGAFGVTTDLNTTFWNILGNVPGPTGALMNIGTGEILPVYVEISVVGTASALATASNPDPGSALFSLFNGYVDFAGDGNPDAAVEITGTNSVVYSFTGLDPLKRYNFAGSAVVGGTPVNTYTQRWTLFRLEGAIAFQAAHTTGVWTNGLATNEVAVNTGINLNGDMAAWNNIVPAADGSFAVRSIEYTGAIPGGMASGSPGYALSGFRLEEVNGATVISNRALGNNILQVFFSAPVDAVGATNAANYSLTNGNGTVAVLAAEMVYDNKTVQLTTTSQLPNAAHWLSLNVKDDGGNRISPGQSFIYTNLPPTAGYVRRELYLNITNGTIAGLTNNPKFPNNPDQVAYLANMAWPTANIYDNYGSRMADRKSVV